MGPLGAVVADVTPLALLHQLAAAHGWHLAEDEEGWWSWPALPGEKWALRVPRWATHLGTDPADALLRLAEEIGEENARVEAAS